MSTPAPAGFTVRPVRNRSAGDLTGRRTLGMVLHVQVGRGGLFGWFDNPASRSSSTWWAGRAGGREQYGNPDTDRFWAQGEGNWTYQSIETEGDPDQPLTPQQIETCAQAYAFGHARYGWPFQLAEKPGQAGLGWHGMGGKAWGNHPGCPGTKRKAQREAILARARQITNQEDDMPLTDNEIERIADAVWNKQLGKLGNDGTESAGAQLGKAHIYAYRLWNARGDVVDEVTKALATLPAGAPVTDEQLRRVLADAFGSLDDGGSA